MTVLLFVDGWAVVGLLVAVQCASHMGSILLNTQTISYMVDDFAAAGISPVAFSVMFLIRTFR